MPDNYKAHATPAGPLQRVRCLRPIRLRGIQWRVGDVIEIDRQAASLFASARSVELLDAGDLSEVIHHGPATRTVKGTS